LNSKVWRFYVFVKVEVEPQKRSFGSPDSLLSAPFHDVVTQLCDC
jgi:hypothetical protein